MFLAARDDKATLSCTAATFDLTCTRDDPWACRISAMHLSRGIGVPQDLQRALKALGKPCTVGPTDPACTAVNHQSLGRINLTCLPPPAFEMATAALCHLPAVVGARACLMAATMASSGRNISRAAFCLASVDTHSGHGAFGWPLARVIGTSEAMLALAAWLRMGPAPAHTGRCRLRISRSRCRRCPPYPARRWPCCWPSAGRRTRRRDRWLPSS